MDIKTEGQVKREAFMPNTVVELDGLITNYKQECKKLREALIRINGSFPSPEDEEKLAESKDTCYTDNIKRQIDKITTLNNHFANLNNLLFELV